MKMRIAIVEADIVGVTAGARAALAAVGIDADIGQSAASM